ncbi:MAG: acyl-CoA/acyl-ACP dehydrogenase [Gammaproteobacteria bacterium]|nr:acyl-CoA/acyl-ACP dehydrogenase [Gammaproteobacteria bacterium]
MDFALSEEQTILQDTVREYLRQHCTLESVRLNVQDSITLDADIARGLLDLGLPGIVVPEEFGGAGLGYLDAALVAEALGEAIAPIPFLGPNVVAPYALQSAGSDQQQADWLPKIASGNAVFGIAFSASSSSRSDGSTSVDSGQINGEHTFVIDANDATQFLMASGDSEIYLVDANDVELTLLRTIDRTRSVAQITMNGTPCELLPGSSSNGALRRSIAVGRIMLAADSLGAAQSMLDKSVAYAKERKQFNRVIGSFQAVKHMCAEMAAELEPCKSLIWYAAHSVLAIPEETVVVACHAKAHLSEVAQFVARKSTEVHGGMGFTDLLGLHYWFKRIGLNRQLLGSPDEVREEAAQAQDW